MTSRFSFSMTADGLSSGRSGAAALGDAFGEFVDAMVSVGGPDYAFDRYFRPGYSRDEVESAFRAAGIEAPDELICFWTLQGGLLDDAWPLLPDSWSPTDLHYSISDWAHRGTRWIELERRPDPERGNTTRDMAWESPEWIVIGRDHPLMTRISGATNAACPVRRCWPELIDFGEASNDRQFQSICTLFDALGAMVMQEALVPTARWDGRPWWEGTVAGLGAWNRINLGTEVL